MNQFPSFVSKSTNFGNLAPALAKKRQNPVVESFCNKDIAPKPNSSFLFLASPEHIATSPPQVVAVVADINIFQVKKKIIFSLQNTEVTVCMCKPSICEGNNITCVLPGFTSADLYHMSFKVSWVSGSQPEQGERNPI